MSMLKTTIWCSGSNQPTSLSYWWYFQICGSSWTKAEPVQRNKQNKQPLYFCIWYSSSPHTDVIKIWLFASEKHISKDWWQLLLMFGITHTYKHTDNQICSKEITAFFLQQRHFQFKNRNQMWQFYYLWFRLSSSLYNWLLIELFLWKVIEPHIFLYYVIYFSVVNYRKLILCCKAKMWSETYTWLWLKSL